MTTHKHQSGLVLDFTGQTLTEPVVLRDCQDVEIIGGEHVGIEVYGSQGITIRDGGINARTGKVGVFCRESIVHVINMDIAGGLNSAVFLDCDDGSFLQNRCSRYGGDGLHLFGTYRVRTLYNRFFGSLSDGVHHPDAIQFHNTERTCRDLLIACNAVNHKGQGINNMDNGELAWMDRIRIVGNKVAVTAPWAINAHHFRDSIVAGNDVTFVPGEVSMTRKVPIRSTKVQVGPGVTYTPGVMGPNVDLIRAAA
jgi:hypothetical protein